MLAIGILLPLVRSLLHGRMPDAVAVAVGTHVELAARKFAVVLTGVVIGERGYDPTAPVGSPENPELRIGDTVINRAPVQPPPRRGQFDALGRAARSGPDPFMAEQVRQFDERQARRAAEVTR
jgi:hypothetical protein